MGINGNGKQLQVLELQGKKEKREVKYYLLVDAAGHMDKKVVKPKATYTHITKLLQQTNNIICQVCVW